MLTCVQCGNPIRQGTKYLAVQTVSDGTGFNARAGCEHLPVPDIEAKVADASVIVFGSGGCFFEWLADFLGGPDCGHGCGTN